MEFSDEGLFALANSVAELLGAPVTIEDPDTIVVAYSGGEQAVDEARIGTILSRQVPLRYREALAEAGVFERLKSADEVIYVELPHVRLAPRVAVAVRNSNSVMLGSIWAAVPSRPTPEQEFVLRSAAPIAARIITREHERTDASRRERVELMSRLLSGGDRANAVARQLGLRGPLVVAAIAGDPGEPIESGLTGSVTLHLGAVSPRSIVAHLGHTTYAVLDAEEHSADRILSDFLARRPNGGALVIGLGREVAAADRLDRGRIDADLVIEAMRRTGRRGAVGTLHELFIEVLAIHAEPILQTLDDIGPLSRLRRHDREHDTQLVETARALLETGGDVAQAADLIHVHANTMRNRLRRAAQSCHVELKDHDTRLALGLELKVAGLR